MTGRESPPVSPHNRVEYGACSAAIRRAAFSEDFSGGVRDRFLFHFVQVSPGDHLDLWEVGVSMTVLCNTGDYLQLARSKKEVLRAAEVRVSVGLSGAVLLEERAERGVALDLDDAGVLQYCKRQLLGVVVEEHATVTVSFYGKRAFLDLSVVGGTNDAYYTVDQGTRLSKNHEVRALGAGPAASPVPELGAVDGIVTRMLDFVAAALQPPKGVLEAGLVPGHGILLHGPPGTGKSAIAQYVAQRSGVNAILHLDLADLVREDAPAKLVQYFEQVPK